MTSAVRHFCVVMEKKALINRWVDYRWEAIAVLPADSHPGCAEAQCLLQDSQTEQWLYPALPLSLHGDEVDDYRLNLSAPEPRLFVVTREDEGRQVPIMISVSYGVAARMLDAGETVDGIPLPEELWQWAAEFSEANFRPPEPKKQKRYARAPQMLGVRS
jgi:hypothetical protein